jgi:hypothetical protein
MLLWILVLAEGDGFIATKGPPRLCGPSAWCDQVARYGGLGHCESEHEKLAMNPWRIPEKVLTGYLCDQMADVTGDSRTPASPATA